MNHIYRTLLAPILVIVLVSLSHADVVELKTGQRVDGTFKQATSVEVMIDVGGHTITFDREKVRAIYFGTVPLQFQQGRSTLVDAMKALKALQAVTSSGLSYQEYATRVADATAVVDRYLADAAFQESPSREPMKVAMDFYIVAERAWHGRITGGTVGLASYEAAGSHPAVAQCPKAQAVAADPSKRARVASPLSSEAYLRGEALAYYGLRDLFECAAEQIGRAERLSP